MSKGNIHGHQKVIAVVTIYAGRSPESLKYKVQAYNQTHLTSSNRSRQTL
jgi:hypothetical protein